MRKVVVRRPGGYRRLVLEEHPAPTVSGDEVAIDVAAAGVNYADCLVRMGLYRSARELVGWPITPGFEVAGRVAEAGPDVSDLGPGDLVLAVTRFGGYATRVVVPRHQVFRCPPMLDAERAAGVPTVFLTAYYALFELARVRPGRDILVHSAAGGVGGALVQLGKLAGCRVVAVVGAPHKVAVVREHGADHIIDTSSEDLWDAAARWCPDGFDVVLDANGAKTLASSYRHLRSPGKLVVYGFHSMLPRRSGRPRWVKIAYDWLRTPRFDPLQLTHRNCSIMAFNLSYLFGERELLASSMSRILGWVDSGRVRALPVTRYPLSDVAQAHRAIQSGATVGKLVLITDRAETGR